MNSNNSVKTKSPDRSERELWIKKVKTIFYEVYQNMKKLLYLNRLDWFLKLKSALEISKQSINQKHN